MEIRMKIKKSIENKKQVMTRIIIRIRRWGSKGMDINFHIALADKWRK
jgi:hypothetical protein